MPNYLKGWRRKAGCVTLVMACVLTVFWFSRFHSTAIININLRPITSTSLTFMSERLGIVLMRMHNEDEYNWNDSRIDNTYVLFGKDFGLNQILPRELVIEWRLQWFGFRSGKARDIGGAKAWAADLEHHFGKPVDESNFKGLEANILSLPHWSIVVPLSLLCAYLLLSKPRKPPEKI